MPIKDGRQKIIAQLDKIIEEKEKAPKPKVKRKPFNKDEK